MSFAPVRPTTYVAPTKVAADTWVIHSVQEALGQPLFVQLNSMVILGAQPMIVDTGTIANRAQWLEDVFSLVEPGDVRWIFLSHDDHDHIGNLEPVLEQCPQATLVASWSITSRLGGDVPLPPFAPEFGDLKRDLVQRGDDGILLARQRGVTGEFVEGLLDESAELREPVHGFASCSDHEVKRTRRRNVTGSGNSAPRRLPASPS